MKELKTSLSLPPFPASNFNSKVGSIIVSDDFATASKHITIKAVDYTAHLTVTKEMIEDELKNYKQKLQAHFDLAIVTGKIWYVGKHNKFAWQEMYGFNPVADIHTISSKAYAAPAELLEHDMPILYPDLRRVPSGEYLVEVIAMDYKRSTLENPMVTAELEILEEGKHKGITLKAYFVVRESGLVGWDNFLNACGFDDVKPGDDFNINTCIGSRLRVWVNDEGWIRSFKKEKHA